MISPSLSVIFTFPVANFGKKKVVHGIFRFSSSSHVTGVTLSASLEEAKSTIMSLGFSASDIVLCVRLAHKVWREARDAANDFRNIATEVASFQLVLEEVQESILERQIDQSKEKELGELLHGCHNVLIDLQQLLARYRSLGTQSKRAWDRIRFGQAPIERIRSRLISNTSLLTSFRSGLHW